MLGSIGTNQYCFSLGIPLRKRGLLPLLFLAPTIGGALLAGLAAAPGVPHLPLAIGAVTVDVHVREHVLGHGSPPVKGYMAIIIAQN